MTTTGSSDGTYQLIKDWPSRQPNLYFIPTEFLEPCTDAHLSHLTSSKEFMKLVEPASPRSPSAQRILSDRVGAKKQDKFVFDVDEWSAEALGAYIGISGLVVDTSTQYSTIVGAYKDFATASPVLVQEYRDKISELEIEIEEKKIDIAITQSFVSVETSELVDQQVSTTDTESQITAMEKQILRLEGLVRDKRPYSVAYHHPHIFKVSMLMQGHRIEQFGKTYDAMLFEFGDEMWELLQEGDLPNFVLAASLEEDGEGEIEIDIN